MTYSECPLLYKCYIEQDGRQHDLLRSVPQHGEPGRGFLPQLLPNSCNGLPRLHAVSDADGPLGTEEVSLFRHDIGRDRMSEHHINNHFWREG